VSGWRTVPASVADAVLDLSNRVTGSRSRLDRAVATGAPRRRVLVAGVDRPDVDGWMDAAVAELRRSRQEVTFALATGTGGRGKFENVNQLIDAHPIEEFDWLVVLDDDVLLPPGFLDGMLFLAERFGYRLAQPAHRRRSHAAWKVTRRRWLSVARDTRFVEIGPVTFVHSTAFGALLPFPSLRMGWGLDAHWAAVAKSQGWPVGVIDAYPVRHGLRPVGAAYHGNEAVDEGRRFLADRPYLRRDELERTLSLHRRW
jgi:hypothetical protein